MSELIITYEESASSWAWLNFLSELIKNKERLNVLNDRQYDYAKSEYRKEHLNYLSQLKAKSEAA